MGYTDKDRQREYQRVWRASRRSLWFKENGPCKKCESEENLELHHLDKSQKEDHKVWSWSNERRLAELAKCIVLCRDCHNKAHSNGLVHGTNLGYTLYRCRCTDCRKAHAIVNRKYNTGLIA